MSKNDVVRARCDKSTVEAITSTVNKIEELIPTIKIDNSKLIRYLIEYGLEKLNEDLVKCEKHEPLHVDNPLYGLLMNSKIKENK